MHRHLELNLGLAALNLELGQWKLQRCTRFIGPESDKARPRQIIPLPKAELSLWFRTRRNRESSCSSANPCVSSVRERKCGERKGQRRGFLSSVRVAPCHISYNIAGNGRMPRGVTRVIGILFFFYFFKRKLEENLVELAWLEPNEKSNSVSIFFCFVFLSFYYYG